MSKITIYGKESAVALETINNVEEHYCTNGMFYVRAEDQEYYFSLEAISMIRVETESDVKDIKWEFDSKDVLDKIIAEINDEAEYAYADFDRYKEDILHAESDELPDDDFRYGLRRAVEIINKYMTESEG